MLLYKCLEIDAICYVVVDIRRVYIISNFTLVNDGMLFLDLINAGEYFV